MSSQICEYHISANSFRGNYSFLELGVRKLFKGGKYSREETIVFLQKYYLGSITTRWPIITIINEFYCLSKDFYKKKVLPFRIKKYLSLFWRYMYRIWKLECGYLKFKLNSFIYSAAIIQGRKLFKVGKY